MLRAMLDWLGFGEKGHAVGHGHGHGHDHEGGHAHTHGVIDPTIATTARGIWAIKWSFVILAITAVFQIVIVILSSSVALLADTIHNVGDAATAIPLWIAFMFARRKATDQFTYGLGRVEDLAGMIVVGLILFSALVAGYQTIDRLLHPQEIGYLGAVAAAGVIGFIGNEVVAVFRIRVGREIQSAALIADGYLKTAGSLPALAAQLGIDGDGLAETVARMNGFAETGVDSDFHRGETVYECANGDASHGPNPTLGRIGTAPYYAVALWPGDIGAATGLATDDRARLLDAAGQPIPGLYACGNDMQSIMGGVYPGPGITIGPAITFGFIAGTDAAARARAAA